MAIFLQGALALANAPCGALFGSQTSEVLHSIIRLHDGPKLPLRTSDQFSWLEKRRLRLLTQEIDHSGLKSEQTLHRWAEEFSTLYLGSSHSFYRRFIKRDLDQNFSNAWLYHQELVRHGLKSLVEHQSRATQERLYWKVRGHIRNLLHETIAGQLIQFPFRLPIFKQVGLTESELAHIAWTGHASLPESVRSKLNSQLRLTNYRSLQSLVASIVLGSFVTHSYFEAKAVVHAESQKSVAQFTQVMDALNKQNQREQTQFFKDLYQSTLESAVKDFNTKWGEPPTDSELNEIKTIIKKKLGSSSLEF